MKHRAFTFLLICCLSTAVFAASKHDDDGFHDGSIRDLTAIGNRNVGCNKGLGNWYSVEKQIAMGKQFAQQVESSSKMVTDPKVTEYINRIGQNLVRNSDSKVPFTIKIIDSDEVNAFALPGGFFYVNSGLILAADNEAELAGVMAHEIAHVTQKHLARMIAGQKYSMLTSLASMAVAILASRANPQAGQAILVASQAGQIQKQLNFTREHEKEADRIGLGILTGAGLDPRGMADFFERMQRATRFLENGAPSYLRTHPVTFERIADIEGRTQSLPYRQVPDSLDFQLVRAKLRASIEKPADAVNSESVKRIVVAKQRLDLHREVANDAGNRADRSAAPWVDKS